ncbi:MAG TPA: Nif3-like dinuclear metal center hexameric protein [bacterium]|nr:Nif3-like dinuclear metal center hexameric protein [bacterium]
MMVELSKLVGFLDDYLKTEQFKDSSWNGLQVEGRKEVKTVVGAVDAGLETFKAATAADADLVLVHHGLFWKQGLPYLRGPARERIKILLDKQVSLYASHLPLDRHPLRGNNALLLKLVGARRTGEFFLYEGQNISWTGVFQPAVSLTKVVTRLRTGLQTECRVLPFGPQKVTTVAVCSGGGGAAAFQQAINQAVDLYITGEATEIYHLAKDHRCSVVFAGHHATETLGIKALLQLIASRWGLLTKFIDIPTGL